MLVVIKKNVDRYRLNSIGMSFCRIINKWDISFYSYYVSPYFIDTDLEGCQHPRRRATRWLHYSVFQQRNVFWLSYTCVLPTLSVHLCFILLNLLLFLYVNLIKDAIWCINKNFVLYSETNRSSWQHLSERLISQLKKKYY